MEVIGNEIRTQVRLSPRRLQVYMELVEGDDSVPTIAGRMGVSVSTLKNHVNYIFSEFGVSSRSTLMLTHWQKKLEARRSA
jgi:DNA-binding NarL/FixJ family response regulator